MTIAMLRKNTMPVAFFVTTLLIAAAVLLPGFVGAQTVDSTGQVQMPTTTTTPTDTTATGTSATTTPVPGGTTDTTETPGVPEAGTGTDSTMNVLLIGLAVLLIAAGVLYLYSRDKPATDQTKK